MGIAYGSPQITVNKSQMNGTTFIQMFTYLTIGSQPGISSTYPHIVPGANIPFSKDDIVVIGNMLIRFSIVAPDAKCMVQIAYYILDSIFLFSLDIFYKALIIK